MMISTKWFNNKLERPGVVLSFALGGICGLLLRLPFFPWRLSSDASNVVGAALGALIGAGAAAVIAAGIATRSDRAAKATVAVVIMEPIGLIREMVKISGEKNPYVYEIADHVTALKDISAHARQRLQMLSSSDRYRGGMAGIAIVDSMLVMDSIHQRMNALSAILGVALIGDRNGLYSMPVQDREGLDSDRLKLEKALALIGHRSNDSP